MLVSGRGLVKRFGDFTAVDHIDVDIAEGEIFGFLGPNGAGKTTTMRMLTTLTPATEGTVEIDGRRLTGGADPIKEEIGIVQQHIALDRDVSVMENIRYHAMLHRIPKAEAGKRIDDLVRFFGMEPYLDRLVINLSGGWKRRVAIICAIVHDPKILFLDEPTAGLDTQSRHMLWELIRKLNSEGTTIFLTTHYMDEAEELCDRVAIIDHGRSVRMGTPQQLCESIGEWTVEYRDADRNKVYRYFRDYDGARALADTMPRGEAAVRRTILEDVFLELTGRDVAAIDEEPCRI